MNSMAQAATAPLTAHDDQRASAITRTAEYVTAHPSDITPTQVDALRKIAGIAQNTKALRDAGHHLDVALTNRLVDADARTAHTDLATDAGLSSVSTLTALERAAFPRVIVEERELSPGTFALHRKATDQVLDRIAWDPAQTTRDKVETYINIYIAGTGAYVEYTPEAADALRGFEKIRRSDPDPKVIETWDTVEQAVISSADPRAAAIRIADLFAAENSAVTA